LSEAAAKHPEFGFTYPVHEFGDDGKIIRTDHHPRSTTQPGSELAGICSGRTREDLRIQVVD
jgi:hypothetical protein